MTRMCERIAFWSATSAAERAYGDAAWVFTLLWVLLPFGALVVLSLFVVQRRASDILHDLADAWGLVGFTVAPVFPLLRGAVTPAEFRSVVGGRGGLARSAVVGAVAGLAVAAIAMVVERTLGLSETGRFFAMVASGQEQHQLQVLETAYLALVQVPFMACALMMSEDYAVWNSIVALVFLYAGDAFFGYGVAAKIVLSFAMAWLFVRSRSLVACWSFQSVAFVTLVVSAHWAPLAHSVPFLHR